MVQANPRDSMVVQLLQLLGDLLTWCGGGRASVNLPSENGDGADMRSHRKIRGVFLWSCFQRGASVRVSTVMSSCWPNCFAASAMALADWVLMAWVRWKPKSSRRSLVASTTPSDTKVRRSFGLSWNVVSE